LAGLAYWSMALSTKADEVLSGGHDRGDGPDLQVSILLVGAGPTGLTLANLLGRYGASTLIIERNHSTVNEPRAVSIDDESLRTMQSIGLSQQILQTVVPGYGSDYLTPEGRCFLTVEPKGRPFGFPRRNAFRQPQLEAQLHAGISRFPNVQALYGWKFESLQQNEQGVTTHLRGENDRVRRVRCSYLIGCDGAASDVRRQLGLRLEGKSFAQRWLIVDLEKSPVDRRNTVVFCDTVRPCIALPGPDLTRRFEFMLHPEEREEDILRPEVVERLLRDHGAHPESILVRKVVYTFHARVAPRWSLGRVFLAGDAAHLTPPFAGQGMNSGLRDCGNLGWKLAMVTAGLLSDKILTTYEEERRDHVWRMIQLALRMGRIMSPKSRLRGWIVQNAFMVIGLWPSAKSFFAEMKYKPKPKFDSGFMQPDGFGKRRTMVGRMLPQPRVNTLDGEPKLLDELLGSGFALVGVGVPESELCAVIAGNEIARFGPQYVALDPSAVPELAPYRGRILLVRPDRYIAASGTSSGPDSIGVAIASLLARFNRP
jgi:3-(3-hydroxy-phenyl)propionate hydroxylase